MEYKITYNFWEVIWNIRVFVWSERISLKNTQVILEFSFAIPGNSAATERFSFTNALWTDTKSHFFIGNIKAVIVTKTHF
jgi:hypothetical protein